MRTFHTGGVAGLDIRRACARRGAVRGARAEGAGDHRRDRRHRAGHPRGRQARGEGRLHRDVPRRARSAQERRGARARGRLGRRRRHARPRRRRRAGPGPPGRSRLGRARQIAVVYYDRASALRRPPAARLRVETAIPSRPALSRRRGLPAGHLRIMGASVQLYLVDECRRLPQPGCDDQRQAHRGSSALSARSRIDTPGRHSPSPRELVDRFSTRTSRQCAREGASRLRRDVLLASTRLAHTSRSCRASFRRPPVLTRGSDHGSIYRLIGSIRT